MEKYCWLHLHLRVHYLSLIFYIGFWCFQSLAKVFSHPSQFGLGQSLFYWIADSFVNLVLMLAMDKIVIEVCTVSFDVEVYWKYFVVVFVLNYQYNADCTIWRTFICIEFEQRSMSQHCMCVNFNTKFTTNFFTTYKVG